jgi:hypothetical protein
MDINGAGQNASDAGEGREKIKEFISEGGA